MKYGSVPHLDISYPNIIAEGKAFVKGFIQKSEGERKILRLRLQGVPKNVIISTTQKGRG
jgi:hypothetical protein